MAVLSQGWTAAIRKPGEYSIYRRYSPEGTLWGRILRSPWPHARVVNIDVSKALIIPGVHAVLKGSDVQVCGRSPYADVPVLADDTVLFIGDKVAAVAAVEKGYRR
ncbi:MAG: hypothetical protein CM1200mP35_00030 [Chloroflexota bacterium]|nr:MAG: hypothetical protein CM1200mP35_00030 [Chloroflexota bacterium]